jgi:N-acetylneuraminate synthase
VSQEAIFINQRRIGHDQPPYVIAELSANHNGSLSRAIKTIDMAKAMGADAIKMQTYNADTMTIDCDKEHFYIEGGLWNGYSLYQLYDEAHTPYAWHQALFEHAKQVGITIFSTPFDETAVELLESLNTPAYKIASFEVTDLPLIKLIAKTGKPIIMSTGMANLAEIEEAVETIQNEGNSKLILLHCISAYPAPVEQCNLLTIADISKRFNVISGLSDHTLGITAAITSVALGACVIEKHVTLSRLDKGPDSEFSLEPNELKALCHETKQAWLTLGKAGYERKPVEEENLTFRRSLFFVQDINQGEIITEEHIRRIRPGYGLPPKYYDDFIGQVANQTIEKGTPVNWSHIDNPSHAQNNDNQT